MLKRNLIVIAIAILGLGITSAFGQAADWEIKPAVKRTKIAKKPKQVQPGNSGGTISNQRTSRTRKPSAKQMVFTNDTIDKGEAKSNTPKTSNRSSRSRKPQNYAMELGGSGELGVRKRTNKSNSVVAVTQKPSGKQPRKRSTQKRQHLPCKQGDCK